MLQGLWFMLRRTGWFPYVLFSMFFNEVFHLATETVIPLAKPVTDATSLQLNEKKHDGAIDQARVIKEHVSQEGTP